MRYLWYVLASLNMMMLVGNGYLLYVAWPFISQDIEMLAIIKDSQSGDAIQFAAQMGRLDVISLLLAVLGLLFVVGSFAGFLFLRHEVISKAEQEARQEIREHGQKIVRDALSTSVIRENISSWTLDNSPLLNKISQRVKEMLEQEDQTNDAADEMAASVDP